MPKYDYLAEDGTGMMEVFVPITEDPPRRFEHTFPSGSVKTMVRVYNAPAVHYKGSGFSTTDDADSILRWQREHG